MATDDLKMRPHELRELHAQVAEISARDVHLGRLLTSMVSHLGHAHGLDVAQMDAAEKRAAETPVSKKGTSNAN